MGGKVRGIIAQTINAALAATTTVNIYQVPKGALPSSQVARGQRKIRITSIAIQSANATCRLYSIRNRTVDGHEEYIWKADSAHRWDIPQWPGEIYFFDTVCEDVQSIRYELRNDHASVADAVRITLFFEALG